LLNLGDNVNRSRAKVNDKFDCVEKR